MRRAFSFLDLENEKMALCKITLTAKSCGVPFVLSLASLFFLIQMQVPPMLMVSTSRSTSSLGFLGGSLESIVRAGLCCLCLDS